MKILGAVLAVALALPLCASLTACKPGSSGGDQPAGGKGGRGGNRGSLTYAVDVLPVEKKAVSYLVTAPGTLDAFERVQVTARVTGAVDKVSFREGQEVKKGDVLVAIDAARYAVAVAGARAAYVKADAAVKDAEAMVTRREGASKASPGLIPGEELETYKTKALSAKADRDVASQAISAAQLNLKDSSVRAPIDGVIQTRTVETGQYVQAGYIMATLLREDPLLLRFNVEPIEAPRLKPGMTATFTLRETLRKFTAKISLIGGAADSQTHLIAVTAQVDTEDAHRFWLRPGSFCDVVVDLSGQREAPLIPRSAARATDHGYVAYVVDGDVAHERQLQLGMSTKDGWIEIRSGLNPGDKLVVRGAEALTEGAKVKSNQVTADSIPNQNVGLPAAASASGVAAGAPAPTGVAPIAAPPEASAAPSAGAAR